MPIALFSGFACSSPTPPAESAATGSEDLAATEEPADVPEDSDPTETGEPVVADTTSAEEAPAAPAGPPLSELCETMCGAQSSECTPKQVKACRLNYCSRYSEAPDACEPSVRSALMCAKAEPDFLLCSNVVPDSCAKKFKGAEGCVKTGVAPEPEEDESSMPDGWAKYEASDANFTVSMPAGVKVKKEDGARVWSSEAGNVKYEVRREPLPKEKRFTKNAFLRIARTKLGKCAPGMKLYSHVERKELNSIQFKTKCPDNTQVRGMFYVHGDDFFTLRSSSSGGEDPRGDTFVYSFERP